AACRRYGSPRRSAPGGAAPPRPAAESSFGHHLVALACNERNAAFEAIEDEKLVEPVRQERHSRGDRVRRIGAADSDYLDVPSRRKRRILRVDEVERLQRGAEARVDPRRERMRRE